MKFVTTMVGLVAATGWLARPVSAQTPGSVFLPAPADTALSLRLLHVPGALADSSGAVALDDQRHSQPLAAMESRAGPARCPMPVFAADSGAHDRMPVSHPDTNQVEPMPVARTSCIDLLWRKVPAGKPR